MSSSARNWLFCISTSLGFTVLLLGLIIIIGWYTHNTSLLQIHPSFPAMQFNTALGFAISGVGLLALLSNRLTLSAGCGMLVATLGLAVLAQYIFNISLGIDELFIKSYIHTRISQPGRMAPNTAVCFFLSGSALLLLAKARFTAKCAVVTSILIPLLYGLAFSALAGYVKGMEILYGLGNLTIMAIHTAIGFITLSTSLVLYCLPQSGKEKEDTQFSLIPGIAAVAIIVFTVFAWQKLGTRENLLIQNTSRNELSFAAERLERNIDRLASSLNRMTGRWQQREGGTPIKEWEMDAASFIRDIPGLVKIAILDPSFQIQSSLAAEQYKNYSLQNTIDKNIFNKAEIPKDAVFGDIIALPNNKTGFIIYTPLMLNKQFSGAIVALVELDTILQLVLSDEFKKQYVFVLKRDGKEIYTTDAKSEDIQQTWWKVSNQLELYNYRWDIYLWPTSYLIADKRSVLPEVVLVGGFLLAMLVAVTIYLTQRMYAFNRNLERKVEARSREIQISASRLQAVLDTVVDGIITINEHRIIQSFNQSACKIFGYSEQEVAGNNINILMPEPYHTAHDGYVQHYLRTGEAKIIGLGGRELQAKRKDGTLFPIELGISEVRTMGERMFVGIVRDITERKKSEQLLRDSAEKIRAIVDNTVDGMITIDERGTIETYNRACEKIFGYTSQEVIGQNIKILMPDPYHTEHDGYLKNYVSTGERKIIGIGREVTGKRKDGTLFPIDLSVSEVKLGERRVFSGIIRDITERKKAEEEKERFIHDLERSNKELDDFAYIASHDLKEPLRGLFNNAKFLKEDYADKLDADGVEMLERLGYLSQRMETLVNDLLYFSRLGRQDLAIVDTDLNLVIDDIKNMMITTIIEQNVQIEIPKPLPIITCDKPRITEVFRNLITNAVKYCDKEEKHIEIGCIASMKASGATEYNVFYVKDNGMGIEKEFFEDIFRIFKRLNEEDDDKKGTGVGLTFVKKIIERHNGRIWLDSVPGQGTTFYFTIKQGV